ncbi:ATP-binding protein [Phytoactinopolyspora endophytica]|uniref:ATP-binding protein n=1 Tax=Phytoactinopolyspora endophytica TaxID=1642495 RepID=UPI00101BFDA4|nr:AAA family ATPase [Phytoactinopolyspora endophytica]
MRDDEIRGILRDTNPWWAARLRGTSPTSWTVSDVALRARANWDMGYRTPILSDVASEPLSNGLFVLRGPRRVGKSVALKDLIVDLLERDDVTPMQVLYFPADTLTSRDLRRYFAIGRSLTSTIGDRRRVWIIDEVTSVPEWTSMLKELRDNTPLADDCVIVTGSSAADTNQAVKDLGAGRTGDANRPFRTLHPMSFADFVRLRQPEIQLPDLLGPSEILSDQARDVFETWSVLTPDLDTLWQDYLEIGGFPRAVAEHHRLGGVSEDFLDELAAWLKTDIDPTAPAESVDLLLNQLVNDTASPVNARNTAEVLGIGRDVFLRRVRRMQNTYAVLSCPRRRDSHIVPGAQSKLYLTDPLLAQLPSRRRPGLGIPDMSRQSETALAVSLARAIDATRPGRWEDGDTVGYHRTNSGQEVDFAPIPIAVSEGTSQTVPIESKWVSQGWRREAQTLHTAYEEGILATKDITDLTGSVWAVPAPILAVALH